MSPFLSRAALALALPAALLASGCDSTDDPDTTADVGVYVTSNPSGPLSADQIVRLSADLAATQATFTGLEGALSIQSVAFDSRTGNAFLTVDIAGGLGGLVYLSGLCQNASSGCSNAGTTLGVGTRTVAGVETGLVAPKGLVVAGNRVIVADNGSNSVRVFSTTASGNVAPEFVLTNLGTTADVNVWDVAYDDDSDRLYVAATNGLVLVYDGFIAASGANGPTRVITPTDGTDQISVNLHGIAYDESRDLLVLSDVGAAAGAGSTSDGQLFTIANASTVSGNTPVRYRVRGGGTELGNPVDLVVANDGTVYVAEKANDLVLRFNGMLTATGTSEAAAAASIEVTKPESVALANN